MMKKLSGAGRTETRDRCQITFLPVQLIESFTGIVHQICLFVRPRKRVDGHGRMVIMRFMLGTFIQIQLKHVKLRLSPISHFKISSTLRLLKR